MIGSFQSFSGFSPLVQPVGLQSLPAVASAQSFLNVDSKALFQKTDLPWQGLWGQAIRRFGPDATLPAFIIDKIERERQQKIDPDGGRVGIRIHEPGAWDEGPTQPKDDLDGPKRGVAIIGDDNVNINYISNNYI